MQKSSASRHRASLPERDHKSLLTPQTKADLERVLGKYSHWTFEDVKTIGRAIGMSPKGMCEAIGVDSEKLSLWKDDQIDFSDQSRLMRLLRKRLGASFVFEPFALSG